MYAGIYIFTNIIEVCMEVSTYSWQLVQSIGRQRSTGHNSRSFITKLGIRIINGCINSNPIFDYKSTKGTSAPQCLPIFETIEACLAGTAASQNSTQTVACCKACKLQQCILARHMFTAVHGTRCTFRQQCHHNMLAQNKQQGSKPRI